MIDELVRLRNKRTNEMMAVADMGVDPLGGPSQSTPAVYQLKRPRKELIDEIDSSTVITAKLEDGASRDVR
eukprot:3592386-Pyramimonas_sp.AAC.1